MQIHQTIESGNGCHMSQYLSLDAAPYYHHIFEIDSFDILCPCPSWKDQFSNYR